MYRCLRNLLLYIRPALCALVLGLGLVASAHAQIATTLVGTSNTNPTAFGQSLILTATVTSANGTPTGSVNFVAVPSVGDVISLGIEPLNGGGFSSVDYATLPVGTYTIQYYYLPTGFFSASSDTGTHVFE